MAQLELPEKYTTEFEALALRDERGVQEILAEAMDAYLTLRFSEIHLTDDQLGHLRKSLAQAERGEHVSESQVEAFFDEWEKEAASR